MTSRRGREGGKEKEEDERTTTKVTPEHGDMKRMEVSEERERERERERESKWLHAGERLAEEAEKRTLVE